MPAPEITLHACRLSGGLGFHLIATPNTYDYRFEALCGHRPGRGKRSRWLKYNDTGPNCPKYIAIAEKRGLDIPTDK